MSREIITSKRTGDSCVHVKHKSGLDIYVFPKNTRFKIEY